MLVQRGLHLLKTVGLVSQARPFLFCSTDHFQYSYPICNRCCDGNRKGLTHKTLYLSFRTVHAYDALCRAKHHVSVRRCSHLVGVQRTVQNNDNVKSEPKYLACEESPTCTLCVWTLSCSSVALLASTLGWLLCLFFSESPAIGCAQQSFMQWGLQNIYVARANHAVLPAAKKCDIVV